MRDANSAPLQKIQIVKGWLADGQSHEQVYDVVCSDGLQPDAQTHLCPNNGAKVNLSDCSISADKGAAELATTWTDPDFDAAQSAFYYARVLENPVRAAGASTMPMPSASLHPTTPRPPCRNVLGRVADLVLARSLRR